MRRGNKDTKVVLKQFVPKGVQDEKEKSRLSVLELEQVLAPVRNWTARF